MKPPLVVRCVKKMRFVLGFLVAPLVPGLLFAIHDLFNSSPIGMGWYLKLAALIGYPLAIILGIPLYHIIFRNRIPKLSLCMLFGFILGVVAYLAVFILGLIKGDADVGYAFTSALGFLPVSGVCGGIAGFSFWLIARPDLKQSIDAP